MNKNLLLCVGGIVVGFVVGLFAANFISMRPSNQKAKTSATTRQGEAPPLPPGAGGELPPNHPDISGMTGNGSPASTSPAAQAAMEEADAKPGDFAAQVRAAEIFFNLRDYDTAEMYLTRALELKPNDFDTLVQMGNTKDAGGDFTGAAGFYERALAIRPNHVGVRNDYANTFLQREPPDLDKAIEEHRKALKIDPRYEHSLQNLSRALIEKGAKAEALDTIARLEKVNPDNSALPLLKQNAEAMQ